MLMRRYCQVRMYKVGKLTDYSNVFSCAKKRGVSSPMVPIDHRSFAAASGRICHWLRVLPLCQAARLDEPNHVFGRDVLARVPWVEERVVFRIRMPGLTLYFCAKMPASNCVNSVTGVNWVV